MRYITLLAVIGILVLHWTGSIPLSSVGGPMMIALAFLVAALAVAAHEAWTNKRGVIGWILNIVVSVVSAFVAAQVGGMAMVTILGLVVNLDGSLARMGDPWMSIALTGAMIAAILGSWAALQIVNRWR